MSRIGNQPIVLAGGVTVTSSDASVVIQGPKGEIVLEMPSVLGMKSEGNVVHIVRKNDSKNARALHGYMRATLANAVTGVDKGWTRKLELAGVGFRASMSGANLVLSLGFSHPVTVSPPAGITFAVQEGAIIISGINNQEVGAVAAKVRALKKPEPYKGKGIKYAGEHIRKKAGKAKAVGGAPGAK